MSTLTLTQGVCRQTAGHRGERALRRREGAEQKLGRYRNHFILDPCMLFAIK